MCSSLTHLGPFYILTHEAEHGGEVTVAAFAGCIFWVGYLASPIHGGLSHTLVTHDCSSLRTALCVESYYSYFFKEEIKAPRHSVSKCQGLMLSECVWRKSSFRGPSAFLKVLGTRVCNFISSPHEGRRACVGTLEFRLRCLAWVTCCAKY